MNENEGKGENSYIPSDKIPGQESEKGWIRETLELFLLAVLVVLPIRLFIANPFVVSGASMVPTFENGDYLIVDEISYRFENPKRGEVIVFKYPKDPSKYFIKRIIGLPGETVTIKNGAVSVKSGGEEIKLEEDYIKNFSKDSGVFALGEGEYFVMGDNRTASSDSRIWGTLPRENISGRALVRLFPPTEIGLFPGTATY